LLELLLLDQEKNLRAELGATVLELERPRQSIADSGTAAKDKNNGRFDSYVYQKENAFF
jgi:hypothetical protein